MICANMFTDSISGRVKAAAVLLVSGFALSACSQPTSTVQYDQQGSASFSVSAPSMLSTRAVVVENLYPTVKINNRTVLMTSNNGQWAGNTNVPEGSNVSLEIDWFETYESRELQLASYIHSIENIDRDIALVVVSEDYNIEIDDDNDTHYNLTERREGSDPFNARSPSAGFSDVVITQISSTDAPVINGGYDAVWGNAQFLDRDGNDLLINKLMIDRGAQQANLEPRYQWAAMHDKQYLYLFVFGEEMPFHTPFKDSVASFNDDALEIFLDGDNSKLNSYDQVDDIHLLIPLMVDGDTQEPNKSSRSFSIIEQGERSAPIDLSAITFATCVCVGVNNRATWEIRIDIQAANIPTNGDAFGFELQIDDDNDGGGRDVKWGWSHISRVDSDVDLTWRFPIYMGNVSLEVLPEI